MALKYAADREQILKALFSGYGTLGNDHPIPPTDPYFNTRAAAAQVRSRKGRLRISRRRGSPIRRSSCRPRTPRSTAPSTGRASAGERRQSRHQGRPEEGAGRRLLGQRLAQGRVRLELLGRPSGRDPDVVGRLRRRARPGTRRTGTTTSSRSCLPTRAARRTKPSASPTSGKCRQCSTSGGGALIPVFSDWLDAHNDKVGGHTPHGGFDMDNGLIMEKAWLKS